MKMLDFEHTETEFNERMLFDDVNAALRIIEPWMARLHRLEDAEQRGQVLGLFAKVATQIFGGALAEAATNAAENPTSTDALYQLGYELQERRHYALSAATLRVAHQQAPENLTVLTELSSALEQQGLFTEAYSLLVNAELGSQFMPSYLLAFNAVMVGQTDQARDLLPTLATSDDTRNVYMTDRIRRMIARADALARHLPAEAPMPRGQHFVRSGGLLILDPVQGHDSYTTVGTVVSGLQAALAAWDKVPAQLMTVPDKESRALSAALGKLWDIPVEDWYGAAGAGLVVMYRSEKVLTELRGTLRQKTPNQSAFIYTAAADREHPVAPDVLGFRGIDHVPAWEELPPDEDNEFGLFADTPEPPSSDEITQAIMDHTLTTADNPALTAMIDFMKKISEPEAIPSIFKETGEREPLWVVLE